MSVKKLLTSGARKLLPSGSVRLLEETYRRGRVKLISAGYGNPAKNLKVIAVTGTNGKTTTVNYINEILKEAGLKTAMFSTALIEVAGKTKLNELNVTVATTSTMQRFFRDAKRAQVDFVVLEITSHALHQHKLAGVPIEVAVMTNLTQDHLDYHKTMENYAATKGRLFASKPKFIVLNRDDDWFSFFDKYKAAGRKLSYGTSEYADVRIKHVKLYRKGSEATVAYSDQKDIELATAMPGRFNVYNMAAAVTVALALNIDSDNITEGVANLEGVPGRFERVVEGKDYDVIVDYAHTPDALEKLLAAARDVTRGRIILVFGATGDRDKAKRPIMGEIAVSGSDKIILTDDETYTENPQGIRDMVMEGIKNAKGESKTEEIGDRRDAIAKALSIVKSGDTILITGMGHERFRIMNEGREAWNDADTVRDILESNNN